MAAKKYNLNSLLKRLVDAEEVPSFWSDAYTPAKYDSKTLYKTHKVPRFKKRFSI